jgi:hypothetical protein
VLIAAFRRAAPVRCGDDEGRAYLRACVPVWNVGGCYDDFEQGEYAGSERKRGIANGALTKAPIKPIDRRRIEDRSDVYSQYLNGTPMTCPLHQRLL